METQKIWYNSIFALKNTLLDKKSRNKAKRHSYFELFKVNENVIFC